MIECEIKATDGEDVISLKKNVCLLVQGNVGKVSDGYHTFDELYEHRCLLWIFAVKMHVEKGGASYRFHHFPEWFVLGIEMCFGQISYHIPEKMWNLCDFVPERQPDFDGHTASEVLERLRTAINI